MEVTDKRRVSEEGELLVEEVKSTLPKLSEILPAFDRVLVKVLPKEETYIKTADAFQEASNLGEVVAIGSGVYMGGCHLSIPFAPTDKVRFALNTYQSLDMELEGMEAGMKYGFVRASDITFSWR